ncbi:MAG: MATE family efflux transporter, partial [Limibacillus sp.]
MTDAKIWNRRVLGLALPIILSNASVPLLGAVDTAVMGHLPDPAYIGAVAVGAMIFSFLYWGFGFLRMGTTGFTAQAFGAEDAEELRATLARPVLLGLVIGLLLIALQILIRPLAFTLMDA